MRRRKKGNRRIVLAAFAVAHAGRSNALPAGVLGALCRVLSTTPEDVRGALKEVRATLDELELADLIAQFEQHRKAG